MVPLVKRIKLFTIAAILALGVGTAQSATREVYPDPDKAKPDLRAALKAAPA